MVVRNKFYRVIEKYRALIKERAKNANGKYKKQIARGNRTKNRILDFYLKNNRWPQRTAESVRERELGTRFENYVSKAAPAYDANFRRIVMATGRVSNHKRKHNVQGFKQEILDFIKEHGRVPSTSYQYQMNEGEATLRHKLDYYTQEGNDMTLLGKVYEVDKCHKSGIPMKYRQKINEALASEEKPLIRQV